MSERRGCAALGVGRSSIGYRSTKPDQAPLRMRICDLVKSRVRYGYFRIYILLRREGWRVNHKRVHRLYRDEGLSLRLKRPRRHVSAAHRERQPAALGPNERWSIASPPTRCSTAAGCGPDGRRCVHARGPGDRGRPGHQRRAGRECRRPFGAAARSTMRDSGR